MVHEHEIIVLCNSICVMVIDVHEMTKSGVIDVTGTCVSIYIYKQDDVIITMIDITNKLYIIFYFQTLHNYFNNC